MGRGASLRLGAIDHDLTIRYRQRTVAEPRHETAKMKCGASQGIVSFPANFLPGRSVSIRGISIVRSENL